MKTQTFYGVWTTDDEMHSSFKAYALTRELAERELKKHYDFYCSKSPEPAEQHIVPLQMIIEGDSPLIDNLQDSNKKDKFDEYGKSITHEEQFPDRVVTFDGSSGDCTPKYRSRRSVYDNYNPTDIIDTLNIIINDCEAML